MPNSDYLSNFSYIFIPFCIDEKRFVAFNKDLRDERKWMPIQYESRYLHRYVSDRLTREYNGSINLYYYRLSPSFAESINLRLDEYCYGTSPKEFKGKKDVTFDFRIKDVQLFSFNTSICMLAFKVEFKNNDPFHIAAAQYYLRKISTEKIVFCDESGQRSEKSFIDLSKEILSSIIKKYDTDFFFYAITGNERANFLTYIDLPPKKNIGEELFHLKWCYNDNFVYSGEDGENDSINYAASTDTVWGISPSAAVCIVSRNEKNRKFVEGTFQKNFKRQYFFTYVLLLHQKYMLYLLLTKLSIDIDDDLDLLEDYKRRLYEFNTKYVFTQISEVPQYQRFYEKVMKIFRIKEMFVDVEEPLARLAEMQRQQKDEMQQSYDKSINAALIALSFLTIFSAIADASGITSNLGWLLSPLISKVIQITAIVLVFVLIFLMFVRIFKIKKKK